MALPAKYTEVMAVIRRRIAEGDFLLAAIPGERRLAEETGVSYMTARKAVQGLIAERVLTRGPTGGLEVHPQFAKQAKPAEVVLLYPAFPSAYLTHLRELVSDFAQRRGIRLRPAQFVHWDDVTVFDAVEHARGAIVIPSGEPIPDRLLGPMHGNRIVVLDGDYSTAGIPSIRLFSDRRIERVFARIRAMGHRRIDCLNTQNRNPEIERRIGLWRNWLERFGLTGRLWDDPAPNYADPTSVARSLVGRLIEEDRLDATAIVSTTCPAALGAIRACWERGVRVGDDLSIASVNIEHPAEFFCPSIAGLKTPDMADVLTRCFDWFTGRGGWQGPLLIEPSRAPLFLGESLAKPRAKSRKTKSGKTRAATH
jgi:DNA-binding LacI/PurR family transcriptional regulator